MPEGKSMKTPLLAAAVAAADAGLVAAAAPAQVAPGDCEQFAFPGNVEFVQGGATVRFFSTEITYDGPGTFEPSPGLQTTVTASIDANRNVNLRITNKNDGNIVEATLSGRVGDDGKGRGGEPGQAWEIVTP